jgi:hypothetical protein
MCAAMRRAMKPISRKSPAGGLCDRQARGAGADDQRVEPLRYRLRHGQRYHLVP